MDSELEQKVARIIGTAILKNDKNYTDDMMALLASEKQAAYREGAEAFVTTQVGARCDTKDTEDFPELKDGNGRCPACELWDEFDQWATRLRSTQEQSHGQD